jgi:hypothetical protein
MIDAEKRPHAIRRLIGDADQRAAKHVPVEPDELVEVSDRDADVAERARSHTRPASIDPQFRDGEDAE